MALYPVLSMRLEVMDEEELWEGTEVPEEHRDIEKLLRFLLKSRLAEETEQVLISITNLENSGLIGDDTASDMCYDCMRRFLGQKGLWEEYREYCKL